MKAWILMVCVLAGLAARAEEKTPIYVVSGGFRSCDKHGPTAMRLGELFDCYVKNAQGKPAPEVIYSCYNSATDRKKGKLVIARGSDPKHPTELATDPFDKTVDAFGDYVKKIADGRPVVWVGHSHGSYLQMRTILKAGDEIKTAGVVSFDPISREKCPPSELDSFDKQMKSCIAKHAVDLDRKAFIADWKAIRVSNECTKFPSDISENDQLKIFGDRAVAAHYYQTADRILHSETLAPASLAPICHPLNAPVPVHGRKIFDSATVQMMRMTGQSAHADLWKDARPWMKLRGDLKKAFDTKFDDSCYLKTPSAHGGGAHPNVLESAHDDARNLGRNR